MERNITIIKTGLVVLLTAALAAPFFGCSETQEGTRKPNQPPTIWLSAAPPEGSVERYSVQLYWGGWDPDGEIAFYEYCITDNDPGRSFDPSDTTGADKWSRVYGPDSTFLFTADQLADTNTTNLVSEFLRSHTFFVRSVDHEGLASPEPAYRSFTARTLSPDVTIQIPRRNGFNPATVPSITTFRWTARDYINDMLTKTDPESVSWIMEPLKNHGNDWAKGIKWIRDLPVNSPLWDDWRYYKAPLDSGKWWTTPPKDFGNYLFAIRAKDEAGAITPVFDEVYNVRRVLVSRLTQGSLLTVYNKYMGNVVTSSANTALTILDLPAGVPVDFTIYATAEHYGGVVSGYRYGWDMADLTQPDQWEIDWTPFTIIDNATKVATARIPARTYFFGTHVFTVEVIDNSQFISRVEVKVNIVQFTMQKNLLLLDDYAEGSQGGWESPQGKGVNPSDIEHDQFWVDMLSTVDGFDPGLDVLPSSFNTQHPNIIPSDKLPLADVAAYKSIIWSVQMDYQQTANFPLLREMVKFEAESGTGASGGKRQVNLPALFMAAGGHLMICGKHPGACTINKDYAPGLRYPANVPYDLDLTAATGTGGQDRVPDIANPPSDQSFLYVEWCLDAIEYALATDALVRKSSLRLICPVHPTYRRAPTNGLRDHTLRAAVPIGTEPSFERLDLRPETAAPGKAHDPAVKGLNVEVYNPHYFLALCPYTPKVPRPCFEAIYGIECFDTAEPTFMQPVAFWTKVFENKIADAQGAVAARSVVFGFPPVMFNPDQVLPGMQYILHDEWQLPRKQ